MLEQIVKKQQVTIDALVATNDRVITTQYDRPMERIVQDVPNKRMPDFMVHDQDAPSDPISKGPGALHAGHSAEMSCSGSNFPSELRRECHFAASHSHLRPEINS
jgi:hypothetical protein